MPQLTASGFTFDRWNDGKTDYAAGSEYTVGTSDAAFSAVWTEWQRTANPAVSPSGTAVDYGDTVTITCETGGAEIHYTTDGTAPNAITGKHKGETVTLPLLTDSIWTFKKWTDGQNEYEAGGSYTVGTSDITMAATWEDITPPADVTGLTAGYPQKGEVKLTWTNPADADFAKVVITYGDTGNITVLKDANPANESTITGLTNGTEYTFTVKSYDERNNASTGVSVKATPHIFSPLETKAGVKPENINVTDDIEVFKLEYEIQDSLNVIPESEGKTFNLECYYVEFDTEKQSLVNNSGITYQWYTGTTGNWQKIEGATSRAYNLTITTGTTYYMLEATCGTAKFYYDISQIYCGAELTANLGKIAYTDGTYSTDLIDGKEVLGIVCEVDAQGKPRKVVGKEQVERVTVSKYGETGGGGAFKMGYYNSYIDGANNWEMLKEKWIEETGKSGDDFSAGGLNADYSVWLWAYGGRWYLPALNELYNIYFNVAKISEGLVKVSGNSFIINTYYSSTTDCVVKTDAIDLGSGIKTSLNGLLTYIEPKELVARRHNKGCCKITHFTPASN